MAESYELLEGISTLGPAADPIMRGMRPREFATEPSFASVMQQSARLEDGGAADFIRDGRRLLLTSGGDPVAAASPLGPSGQRYSIEHLGISWTLKMQPPWQMRSLHGTLSRNSSEQAVIRVRYRGMFAAGASITGSVSVTEHVPAPVLALALRLTLRPWFFVWPPPQRT